MPSVHRNAFVRGTRVACACVAKPPGLRRAEVGSEASESVASAAQVGCSWLAPHLNALRLAYVLREDVPTRAHLAHFSVIARGVPDVQLRCVHGFPALKARFHFRIRNSSDEQRPLDGIRRAAFTEMRLNRMRQRLEEVAILPRTDIETRRARLRLPVELAGKMPFGTATGRRSEHERAQTIAIIEQDTVRN